MSGRPKPGRGDEAEQLRQLTREAHEAAQELREATRDYKATIAGARAEVQGELQAYMRAEVDKGIAILAAIVERQEVYINANLQDVYEKVKQWESALVLKMRKIDHMVQGILADPERAMAAAVAGEQLIRAAGHEGAAEWYRNLGTE